jgi:hypothetical protein
MPRGQLSSYKQPVIPRMSGNLKMSSHGSAPLRSHYGVHRSEDRSVKAHGPAPGPARALEEHKERQDKERITAGSRWHGSPCVFTTPIGTLRLPRFDGQG